MSDETHPDGEAHPAVDEETPVRQLVSRIKTSRDTCDTVDAAQQLIDRSRRRREDA